MRRAIISGLFAVVLCPSLALAQEEENEAEVQADTEAEAEAEVERDWNPIQLGVIDPVQIVPSDENVGGFRLTLFYGRNHHVTGLDLLALGLNVNDGDSVGLNVAVLGVSWVNGRMKGVQYALIMNAAQDGFVGVQFSPLINYGSGDSAGVQVSFAANVARRMSGVQFGYLNVADEYSGLQVGFVNIVRQMRGVQIGLINVITEGVLPFMILANAMF